MQGKLHQLVFTSVAQGLDQGAHGFCTVARSPELPERLVRELEARSRYENWKGARPTIHRYHPLDVNGKRFYILTRIGFAGTDYSHRANHLAHHLILEGDSACFTQNPASILLHWTGFFEKYQGKARWIEPLDLAGFNKSLRKKDGFLPAKHWEAMTQSGESAAAWLEATFDSGSVQPLVLMTDKSDTTLLLRAFQEALALLPPPLGWEFPFTTFVQEVDVATEYRWVAGLSGSSVEALADKLKVQREHLSPSFSLKCDSAALRGMAMGRNLFVAE
ncbi:MAG: hypothetical protein MK080_06655 [Opitutales bacterium]|nr:hypothetical protein [Opitutales bacterium]NRA25720.1 hypothetical protein [Opitutales bacterium]